MEMRIVPNNRIPKRLKLTYMSHNRYGLSSTNANRLCRSINKELPSFSQGTDVILPNGMDAWLERFRPDEATHGWVWTVQPKGDGPVGEKQSDGSYLCLHSFS